jgi:hypothetical protein
MRPRPNDEPLRSVPTGSTPDATKQTPDQPRRQRLGRVEYLLLALIAIGVAITLAMALLDPSW